MEKQQPVENKMGVEPIRSLVLKMSFPMMVSMLMQAMYNIVDSIFVSRISENALTAVSLVFPYQMLIVAVAVGTGVSIPWWPVAWGKNARRTPTGLLPMENSCPCSAARPLGCCSPCLRPS